MAHYKVGKRYLDDEEYDAHVIEIWGVSLFLIGAFVTGCMMNDIVPEAWDKILRFAAVVTPAVAVGGILGFLAPYIRTAFYAGIFYAVLAGVIYWVWSVV